MRPLGFALACLVLCTAPSVVGACHHDDHAETTDATSDVVYQGDATDEALNDMLALAPKSGDKRARFSSPTSGAKLSGDAPTFAWTFGAAALDAGTGSRRAPRPRHRPDSPFYFGERAALAHGDPMNGTGYFLVLSTASDPKLLRVFTSETSYKPDAAAWDKIKKAGGTVTAKVTTALFDNNKVLSGGGPFEGEAITFEVSP